MADGLPTGVGDGGPAVAAAFGQPSAIARDGAGNIYIADTLFDRIRRIDAATGVITTIAGTGRTSGAVSPGAPAILNPVLRPVTVTATAGGKVFWAGNNDCTIYTIDTQQNLEVVAGTGSCQVNA